MKFLIRLYVEFSFAFIFLVYKKTRIWLKQVPPVVISALFFKEILLADGKWLPHFNETWAGMFALLIGITTRNLLITVIAGILVFELLKYFLN